jgi:CHAD domain-containing protein
MPANESLLEYYLHQHRNIENYLELCMIHAEAELVHELRLSIKKLRAFYKLAAGLSPADKVDHFNIKNRVRRLFRISGQLRDTQVQIHLLVTLQQQLGIEYPEFSKWMLKRENKRVMRFGRKPVQLLSSAIPDATLQKTADWITITSEETIFSEAGKVLTGLCIKARKLSAGTRNERDLHRIRTITKQVKYILNIMHHSYPDFIFNEVSVNSLREIEASVGHWHDNLVRVELLEKFMKKSNFADDSLMLKYQKLLDACKAELDSAYAEAYRIVRSELVSEQPESTD